MANFFRAKTLDDPLSLVRFLRGKRCSTKDVLFHEWAAALQFPYYFGHNWNAFEECINDLEWLPARNYIFVVTHSEHLLAADDQSWSVFTSILDKAAQEWAKSLVDDIQWPRPSTPFHVVFHCEIQYEAAMQAHLQQAGIQFTL